MNHGRSFKGRLLKETKEGKRKARMSRNRGLEIPGKSVNMFFSQLAFP